MNSETSLSSLDKEPTAANLEGGSSSSQGEVSGANAVTQGGSSTLRSQVVLLLATMSFKFAFETMSGAVGLFVLTRFGANGATILAALLILYGICQSAFSSVISQIVVRVANVGRILSAILASMGLLVSVLLILEVCSGGKTDKLGSWPKELIFPIYMLFGGCVGMMEISRKVIPKQLLNEHAELKKLNAKIHICYEVAGTAGAFLSTPMILYLGPMYALCHLPPFFFLSAVLFWHTVPHATALETSKEAKTPITFMGVVRKGISMVIEYVYSIKEGGRLVLTDRRYWWLIFAFVIPQVLHRLIENLLFPVLAKKVLNNGSVSGIMLGGSNFGELLGALLVLLLSKRTKNPLVFSRIDAVLLGLLWVFPFIPFSTGQKSFNIAGGIAPMMIFVSGFWAAGDVSLLSYIQSSFDMNSDVTTVDETSKEASEKEKEAKPKNLEDILDDDVDDAAPNSPLALAMGFLYACYALIVSFLAFGFGRMFDYFDQQGDIHEGFFYISGVIFSGIAVIIFISTFVPKNEFFTSKH